MYGLVEYLQGRLEEVEQLGREECLAHQASTALSDLRVQQDLEDQLVSLDQLVVQGSQGKQDLQGLPVHQVQEEM